MLVKKKLNLDGLFVKSRFLQKVKVAQGFVIWHSLFGYPKIVSKETINLISLFKKPRTPRSLLDNYEIKDWEQVFSELISGYFLIPTNLNERKLLLNELNRRTRQITNGSHIDYLELRVSELCNFKCSYCIQSSALRVSKRNNVLNKQMDFRIARKAIVGFLKILDLHRKNVAEISFGGGEPLLNWKVIQQVVEYCHKQYSNKFSFHFSINTNGSLITSQIASIIKKYDIEVAPSIDGLESGNDKVRIYKNGKGTFQAINESLNLLRLYEIPIKGVSVTLNEKNFAELNSSFIDWAVKYGMKAVHINIDVVNMVSISTKKVIEKLIHLKQYAQQYGIEISGFWARPTENLNESICFLV